MPIKSGALALGRRPVIRVAAGARDLAELCSAGDKVPRDSSNRNSFGTKPKAVSARHPAIAEGACAAGGGVA